MQLTFQIIIYVLYISSENHGYSGPVHISDGSLTPELIKAWVDAGKELDYDEIDVNGNQGDNIGTISHLTRYNDLLQHYNTLLSQSLCDLVLC